MPDGPIELVEHSWVHDVGLSAEEAAALARADAGVEVRPTTVVGRYDLRASSVVGTLVMPTRPVIIRPKVQVDRLMWMLDIIGRVPAFGPEARFDEDRDLLSTMQAHYARLLGRALAHGPVREYVATEEDLQALRGRPDVLHTATRRFGAFPPVRCRFQEFSADTEVNRLLLAAALLLARWRRSDDARRLDSLAATLEGVAALRYAPDRVPEPGLDRRYSHVLPALRLAQLVLRRASFEFRQGKTRALSFLVDMNRVFEEFVIEGLRRVLGLSRIELVAHPPGHYLDLGRQFRLLPDGLWVGRDGRPLAVLDAKYKSGEGAFREDIYQMAAYSSALGIERAVLVYADVPAREYRLVHGPKILAIRLGLDGTTDELSERFASVGEAIARFVGVSSPRLRVESLRISLSREFAG